MDEFKQAFADRISEITVAFVKVAEYRFKHENLRINEPPELGIKVYKDWDGQFTYTLSHHYHGSSQSAPYMSSKTGGFNTLKEALEKAKNDLFPCGHYSASDTKADRWVKNPDF